MSHNRTIADLTDEEIEEEAKRFSILAGIDYEETKTKFYMLKKQGVERKRENESVEEYIKRVQNEQRKKEA